MAIFRRRRKDRVVIDPSPGPVERALMNESALIPEETPEECFMKIMEKMTFEQSLDKEDYERRVKAWLLKGFGYAKIARDEGVGLNTIRQIIGRASIMLQKAANLSEEEILAFRKKAIQNQMERIGEEQPEIEVNMRVTCSWMDGDSVDDISKRSGIEPEVAKTLIKEGRQILQNDIGLSNMEFAGIRTRSQTRK
ncbi:MAG: hypothetical protein ABH851_02595 [Methanobacteriota archaeon]